MLRQLPGPIGIISVAGMYRTGKSYLLNRMLLNRSGGFGVGPTINPCTKVSLLHPVSSCTVILGSLTVFLGGCPIN
jgi:hypothetical protein